MDGVILLWLTRMLIVERSERPIAAGCVGDVGGTRRPQPTTTTGARVNPGPKPIDARSFAFFGRPGPQPRRPGPDALVCVGESFEGRLFGRDAERPSRCGGRAAPKISGMAGARPWVSGACQSLPRASHRWRVGQANARRGPRTDPRHPLVVRTKFERAPGGAASLFARRRPTRACGVAQQPTVARNPGRRSGGWRLSTG